MPFEYITVVLLNGKLRTRPIHKGRDELDVGLAWSLYAQALTVGAAEWSLQGKARAVL